MKKQIITLILMVSIIITIVPFSVSAATNGTCGENLTWSLDAKGTLVISGEGKMYDYNYNYINEEHIIDTPWFDERNRIKSVIIEEGITQIGDFAFRGCDNLTCVTFPSDLIEIGYEAFWGCNLSDVTFPDGLIELGNGAFMCTNLSKVILPDSLKKIDDRCFHVCESLSEIYIGKSVEYIGDSSFSVTKLSSVTIPQSVKYIGECVFAHDELNNIYYEGTKVQWDNIEKSNVWDYAIKNGEKLVISYNENGTTADYTAPDSNVLSQENVSVYINGKKIKFDVQPQIINGRTMVPLRKIFEELGAIVGWFGDNQEIWANRGVTTIRMNIGYRVMYRNIQDIFLDVAPQLVDGRTLVPVRAIAESFDADVQWDGNTKSVLITVDDLEIDCANCIDGCIGCFTCNEYEKDINTKYQTLRWEIENGTSSNKVSTAFETWRTLKVSQLDHILNCSTWGRKECLTCNGTGIIANNSTSNNSSVNDTPSVGKYYSGTIVPEYTSVTGIPLKEIENDENGIIYKYDCTKIGEYSEFSDYVRYLYENGWSQTNKSENEDMLIYWFVKSGVKIQIGYVVLPNEIWLSIMNEQDSSTKDTNIPTKDNIERDTTSNNKKKDDKYEEKDESEDIQEKEEEYKEDNSKRIREIERLIDKTNDSIDDIENDVDDYKRKITKIEAEIDDLTETLNNVQKERNVRVFKDGNWVWEADARKTEPLIEDIDELKDELKLYEDLLAEAEKAIEDLEKVKSDLEDELSTLQ